MALAVLLGGAAATPSTASDPSSLPARAAGSPPAATRPSPPSAPVSVAELGDDTDMDADGRADVFRVDPVSGQWSVSFGGTSTWTHLASAPGVPISQLRLADMDGDSRSDVFRVDPVSGQWSLSSGGVGTWTHLASAPGVPISQLRLADIADAPGADVFRVDPASGQWSVSSGGTSTWTPLASAPGAPISQLRLAHIQGNRTSDVFRVDPSSGRWSYSFNARSPWADLASAPGVPISQLRVANLDGLSPRPGGGQNPVYVSDVFRVDPASGRWSVSYGAVGSWTELASAPGVPVSQLRLANLDGIDPRVARVHAETADVFRVDPVTGQWSVSYGAVGNWTDLASAPGVPIDQLRVGGGAGQ